MVWLGHWKHFHCVSKHSPNFQGKLRCRDRRIWLFADCNHHWSKCGARHLHASEPDMGQVCFKKSGKPRLADSGISTSAQYTMLVHRDGGWSLRLRLDEQGLDLMDRTIFRPGSDGGWHHVDHGNSSSLPHRFLRVIFGQRDSGGGICGEPFVGVPASVRAKHVQQPRVRMGVELAWILRLDVELCARVTLLEGGEHSVEEQVYEVQCRSPRLSKLRVRHWQRAHVGQCLER